MKLSLGTRGLGSDKQASSSFISSDSRKFAIQHLLRATLLLALLLLACFILRPVVWEFEAKWQEMRETLAIANGKATASPEESINSPEAENAGVSNAQERESPAEELQQGGGEGGEEREQEGEEEKPPEHALEAAADDSSNPPETTDSSEENKGETVLASSSGESQQFAKGVRPILTDDKGELPAYMQRPLLEPPGPDQPFPGKDALRLSKRLVDFRTKENLVLLTFTNFAFMDFAVNWVKHLKEAGAENILVGAMDDKTLEALYNLGVPCFDLQSGLSADDVGWGTPIFHLMGREKVTLVNVFLSLGVEILICDTDTVWLRNPIPYVSRYPEADVLTSSDNLVNSVDDDGLEMWDRAQGAYNIGILLFRPTPPSIAFARAWAEDLAPDNLKWDQNAFNEIMRKTGHTNKVGEAGEKRLFSAFDGLLTLGILPVSLFCSGHTFFVQHMNERLALGPPYAIHTTFQFSGTPGKRHRLREAKAFYDASEYYSPEGGIFSFDEKIPEEILSGGEHNLMTHFTLINYQLRQLRDALAIGILLKKTLVLPTLHCRFDRIWYPHNGILDGVIMKQPFVCPADHVIQVDKMLPGELNEAEFGPATPFREYSFLENKLTPESFKSGPSVLRVDFCTPTSIDASDACPSSVAGENGETTLLIPKRMKENQFREAFAPYLEFSHIRFSTSEGVFGGWDDADAEKKFNWRVRHSSSIWCCVNAHPGHIWYDFFGWDKQFPEGAFKMDELGQRWEPRPPKDWQDDHPAWE